MATPLLHIDDLQTHFFTDGGVARAVDGVSLTVERGETLAIVGESGCGKSVTAMSVMGLVPNPPGRIVGGRITFDGKDLLSLDAKAARSVRGNDVSMIFQEPMTSLNPVFRVGKQIGDVLRLHRGLDKEAARAASIALLDEVGIPAPDERIDDYPHQLSGGMRQRIMIAMALACDPKLLIADEPTTALDVTVQAQILELMKRLQRERDMAILLITHDLGVVAEIADRVAVMYAGKIAESASAERLFANPTHPYTLGLFKSIPTLMGHGERLHTIKGTVPPATRFPEGCRFHPRCPEAVDRCSTECPALIEISDGHGAACWMREPARVSEA